MVLMNILVLHHLNDQNEPELSLHCVNSHLRAPSLVRGTSTASRKQKAYGAAGSRIIKVAAASSCESCRCSAPRRCVYYPAQSPPRRITNYLSPITSPPLTSR